MAVSVRATIEVHHVFVSEARQFEGLRPLVKRDWERSETDCRMEQNPRAHLYHENNVKNVQFFFFPILG